MVGGEQAGNGRAIDIDDAPLYVGAYATESEGDAAGDCVGLERRLVDRQRPIGFRDREPLRRTTVLAARIVGDLAPHRAIEPVDRAQQLRAIDAFELSGERLERVGAKSRR